MRVAALRVGGGRALWRDLGFEVGPQEVVMLGAVRAELGSGAGSIESWALEGENVPDAIDGLPTTAAARSEGESGHPNGVSGIDHIVLLTPSLDRTTTAFAEIGVERRRVREAGDGARQGFFLLGDLLVEVVVGTGLEPDAPARFWGITLVVEDIEHAASLLGDRLSRVKDAIQPGRRIATVQAEASGGLPLALITPRD